MSAIAKPLGDLSLDPGLRPRVVALRDEHASLWRTTADRLPAFGPRTGFWHHLSNARAARRLIDDLAMEVCRLPDGEAERRAWRESVRARLQRFGDERLGWPSGYRSLVFGDAFFEASLAFARQARAFDPELSLQSVWQALRNVWIGNSLQMLLERPVRLNPGLFAYSMLYPLTDNLLDDPTIGPRAKRAFNERFGHRLTGGPAKAASPAEAAVFQLVAQIEDEFPRREHRDVFESLLAIHNGQVLSLRQQAEPNLSDAEILSISCEKGGSSVLADLHLVTGSPSAEEEQFAFGYGVFLQLLDDLQDAREDLIAGHQTLFTRTAAHGPLDGLAARLGRFIDRVLDTSELLAAPALDDRRDLIRRNCRSLLVGAVVEQPELFTRAFARKLASHWPFGMRAMRRLRQRAESRFGEAGRVLQQRTKEPSLLHVLLSA